MNSCHLFYSKDQRKRAGEEHFYSEFWVVFLEREGVASL